MVTTEANTIILNTVIENTIDNIDVISLENASGEILRHEPTETEIISSTARKFTFYFTESEANDTITTVNLYGNGATTTLGTGVKMATQTGLNIPKTNLDSLRFEWTVEVIQ